MKSLMLKLLTSVLLLSSAVFAQDATQEQSIIAFLQKAIVPNENYAFDKVVILQKDPVKEQEGWMVYFVRIDLKLKKQEGKLLSINDMIFTNGKLISKDFVDVASNRSIKSHYTLAMPESAYNKEHLLAGKLDAPHKIVVFSDPLCPFCMDFLPEVITDVQKNPDTFALFYYHFPLNIHPASPTLIKAMLVAEEQGDKEMVLKMYKAFLDTKEQDEKLILELFNQTFQKKVTREQINQAPILQKLESDVAFANQMMINGTPTVYLDGKNDETKRSYRNFIKEKK